MAKDFIHVQNIIETFGFFTLKYVERKFFSTIQTIFQTKISSCNLTCKSHLEIPVKILSCTFRTLYISL